MLKTLIYSVLVLCGGFAAIGFFSHDPQWTMWLAAFMAILAAVSIMQNKKAPKERPEALESVLPSEAAKALKEGKIPQLHPDLMIYPDETCLWYDQVRTDYYDSKPRVLCLTTRRLFCADPNFRFSSPIEEVSIEPGKRGVSIKRGGKPMNFLLASPEALLQAWQLAKPDKISNMH